MASREFSYGSIKFLDDVLGIGSYGKVCKAKYGQLPCAAKLLHDTLFQDNDPGSNTLARRFEQECQFLSSIKHPNIVQYLGTTRDPKSGRPVLLMELMDESLTKFLEQSSLGLPYHSQLNICHDVALALAYLHSNTIIHRDLSSNNVLLIGEGIIAKVTDLGMSKLTEMNPGMTQLTQCPGTQVYMPPEALITPPHYSSKLDIFSHGVLIIQIITRNFPNPGGAIRYVDDPNYPSGRALIQIPEADRRKKDINLIEKGHPLLPIALHGIKDRDRERPSADKLCEGLASLKSSARYKDSVKQTKGQTSSAQRLQLELEAKEQELKMKEQVISDLQREKRERQRKLEVIEQERRIEREDRQRALKLVMDNHLNELQKDKRELSFLKIEKEKLTSELIGSQARERRYREELEAMMRSKTALRSKSDPPKFEASKTSGRSNTIPVAASQWEEPRHAISLTKWRRGKSAPENMTSHCGGAVVHGNTAYFSQNYNVYSYTLSKDEWMQLPSCEYRCFSLAVVNDKLTAIGGRDMNMLPATNSLFTLTGYSGWKKLSPMSTPRALPATVTTTTHLVVAGGKNGLSWVNAVEVLAIDTHQWSTASSLPRGIEYPHMTLCGSYLYISGDNAPFFSFSVARLLQSCQPPNDSIDSSSISGSAWTRRADITLDSGAALATLGGYVLALGSVKSGQVIHSYDTTTDSWKFAGNVFTPRKNSLVAVLPSNELVVLGGEIRLSGSKITEVCKMDYLWL